MSWNLHAVRLSVEPSLFYELQKVFSITALEQRLGESGQLRGGDESHAECDLFRAGDLEALAFFKGGYEA